MEMYWKNKNAGSTKVWSGFKIWPDDGGAAWYASEPVEMEYVFQELGFTDPNAGSEEATGGEGTDMEMADSGASALFTAAATAFAAALLL